MSSTSRLALLVGVVVMGAAVYGIFVLMREDTSDPRPGAEAYLAAWSEGDWDAMAETVVDPPSGFADAHQAVVDDLQVAEATYELDSIDRGGDTAVARYHAALQLRGLGRWDYDGTLTLDRRDGEWLVDWSPASLHPELGQGEHLERTREMPERAPILDADDQPISTGRAARVIGLEPRAIVDLNQIKAAFQSQLGIDPAAIDAALGARGVQPDHFVTITTVDQSRYDQVAPVIYPLPGTRFRDTFLRGGPTPEFAAHVLGSFGEVTAERLEELGDPYQAGDLVGLTGIEALYETQLAGTPSGDIMTVAAGDQVEVIDRIEGRAPQPVRTTLDQAAQAAVEVALGTTTSPTAVVVVDAAGNVRAAASRPLGEFNRAFGGAYPPGSTFKVVTTAALLGRGVTPDTTVECQQTTNAGGRLFRNFESSSLGPVPFGVAFAQSCNTAFISTSADVPDTDLVAAAESFGFNADYSVGLSTEGGSFPVPASVTEHAAAVIGQGKVTASPLHMATVGATVLDGTWEPPVLLRDPPPGGEQATPAPPPATQLAAGASDTLLGLMRRVVAEGSGTAAAVPGADIAGKTGTAEYDQGDPPPTHAWFIGIRDGLSVSVLVEGGGVGGQVAAPLAGQVLAGLPG
jgi:cell division protein FtsI/penicillin-binding protein 2